MKIREAKPDDAEAIARVHVESWHATYRGIVSDEYLASLDVGVRAKKWHEHIDTRESERRVFFVACDEAGEIFGFVAGGPALGEAPGFDAELYAIYLRPGAQRRGAGRALVAELAWGLEQLGFGSLIVWVLRGNPARAFYEALGGMFVREATIEIGGRAHSEVAFGWQSFDQLRVRKRGLRLEPYTAQLPHWPRSGRHILAQFDDESVVVYQAYRPSIAEFAVAHQRFGGEFSFGRMSWVKPNFLWMMYRSGWAEKEGQERVLAVRVRRDFFERMLAHAELSLPNAEVRMQWDPDHAPSGAPLERRAIQLGLRASMLREYATVAIIEIVDVTPLALSERANAKAPHAKLRTPRERVFWPNDPRTRERIGLDTTAPGAD